MPAAVPLAIVGGSIIGGVLANKGAKSQGDAAAKAAGAQSKVQWNMYQQNRADLAPWREAGERSLADLERVQGTYEGAVMDPSQYKQSPGYNWLEQQGRSSINRQSAAQGQFGSGRHQKDLTQYGQGLALQDYQGYLGRLESLMNRYAGTSQVGQTSSAQVAGLGANAANQVGQGAYASEINQGNARTGLYQNLSNIGTNATNQFMLNNSLQNMNTQQPAQQSQNTQTIRGGQGGGYGF